MRLLKVLEITNQIEKSSFLKILDNITSELKSNDKEINKIFSDCSDQIKNVDNANIIKLFGLVKESYTDYLRGVLQFTDIQLDILTDILIRDGNSIMSREWFHSLYKKEMSELNLSLKEFKKNIQSDLEVQTTGRNRDYIIYKNCVETSYLNDLDRNRESVITHDEKSILNTLCKSLELSTEEARLIYYSIVKLEPLDLDKVINSLKEVGVVFYHRKSSTIYIPDEFVWMLRNIKNVELSNKFFRRILRQLSDGSLNRIIRKHNIDTNNNREDKINSILKNGVSVKSALLSDIYKDNIGKSEKKIFLSDLINKKLGIKMPKIGVTSEERVKNLINYYLDLEKEDNIEISIGGYSKLMIDLNILFPKLHELIKYEFELQSEIEINTELLLDYNIRPRDILNLFSKPDLIKFCVKYGIKKIGNVRKNIIESYKDYEDLYLENYVLVANRDKKGLEEKGLTIKESEFGVKFEELSKKLFAELGFKVDEELNKKLTTKRLRMDILLNNGNNELIIVECKTNFHNVYSKYTAVTRQLKSYEKLCTNSGFRVMQILLLSNNFSDDFISDCENDYDLELSLLTASGFLKIINAFKESKKTLFPVRPFMKGGLLDDDRIVKAILKK